MPPRGPGLRMEDVRVDLPYVRDVAASWTRPWGRCVFTPVAKERLWAAFLNSSLLARVIGSLGFSRHHDSRTWSSSQGREISRGKGSSRAWALHTLALLTSQYVSCVYQCTKMLSYPLEYKPLEDRDHFHFFFVSAVLRAVSDT